VEPEKAINKSPATIDEVIAELDRIIEWSIAENNYLGIFAYVYRRTTLQIKKEINRKAFEDNARMEQFDVVFANLYLDALNNYIQEKPISRSWRLAFDAKCDSLAVIQHLMMGMNAHINLDLGIAASEIMKDQPIEQLKHDFYFVNNILFKLTDEMQDRLNRVSVLMFVMDWLGGTRDEQFINFNLEKWRSKSWKKAQKLWTLEGEAREREIIRIDHRVMERSRTIGRPTSLLLRVALKVIRFFEKKSVGKIIDAIKSDDGFELDMDVKEVKKKPH